MNVDTVYQYNRMLGVKSLHPLVSVINFSDTGCKLHENLKTGFYSVLLREYKCEYYPYGRKECDYSDGTVMFLAPGEILPADDNRQMLNSEGRMLVFHPDLVIGTSLGVHLNEYSFFSYRKEESLHISQREKTLFTRCLDHISEELHYSIDRHSGMLVTKSIELLLDYCLRFYERQFIVRCEENKKLLQKTERIIELYFTGSKAASIGLPTEKYCAEQLGISTAYFVDLLKVETGMTVKEYVESKRMETARRWLLENNKTIAQIAAGLGFPSPEYFSRLFKRLTGLSPVEFRNMS